MEQARIGRPSRTDEKAGAKASDLRSLLERELRERLIIPMEIKLPQSVKGHVTGSSWCGCSKRA